jgi:hypothetical protein
MTRYLLLFDSYGFVFVWRPLWREDGSILCIYWPLPVQSFSGPSPLGLATIFYCLRFETSIFVASYDSQGHGGGVTHRLHTSHNLLLFSLRSQNSIVRAGPHREHLSQQFFSCCITWLSLGPRRDYRFPITPSLCVTNLLSSNGRVCRAVP